MGWFDDQMELLQAGYYEYCDDEFTRELGFDSDTEAAFAGMGVHSDDDGSECGSLYPAEELESMMDGLRAPDLEDAVDAMCDLSMAVECANECGDEGVSDFLFQHARTFIAALARPGFIAATSGAASGERLGSKPEGDDSPLADVATSIMRGGGFYSQGFEGGFHRQDRICGADLARALRFAAHEAARHYLALEQEYGPTAAAEEEDDLAQLCAVTHLLTSAVSDESQPLELPLWGMLHQWLANLLVQRDAFMGAPPDQRELSFMIADLVDGCVECMQKAAKGAPELNAEQARHALAMYQQMARVVWADPDAGYAVMLAEAMANGKEVHRQAFQAVPEEERLQWGAKLAQDPLRQLAAGGAAVQAARLLTVTQAVQLGGALQHAGRSPQTLNSEPLAPSMAALLHAACHVTESRKHPQAAARLLSAASAPPETVAQQLAAAAAGAACLLADAMPTPAAAAAAMQGRSPHMLVDAPAAFLTRNWQLGDAQARATGVAALAALTSAVHAVVAPPAAADVSRRPPGLLETCLTAAARVLAAAQPQLCHEAAQQRASTAASLPRCAELLAAAALAPGLRHASKHGVLLAVSHLSGALVWWYGQTAESAAAAAAFAPHACSTLAALVSLRQDARDALQADFGRLTGALQQSQMPRHLSAMHYVEDFARVERALAAPLVLQPHGIAADILGSRQLWAPAAFQAAEAINKPKPKQNKRRRGRKPALAAT